MDLSRRLAKALAIFRLSEAVYDKPDFNKMSEEEITQHLVETLKRNHRDNNVKTLDQAIRFISRLSDKLVSSKERKLLVTIEQSYWNGELEG